MHYLGMNQLMAIAQIRVDAGINNLNFDSPGTTQNIDGCPSSQKVVNHLRSDFARIGTNALDCYSDLSGDDIDSLLRDDGSGGPLNRGQAVSDFFKTPQAAGRFRECQLSFAGCVEPRVIAGVTLPAYLRDEGRRVGHWLMS